MNKEELQEILRSCIERLTEMENNLAPIWELGETPEVREVGNEAWERVTSLLEFCKLHSSN